MLMMQQLWFCCVLLLCAGADQQMNNTSRCHRRISYEEVQFILAHSPCTRDFNKSVTRIKRDGDTDSSSHVYALQATIKDHRTIIDDHRTMINYLLNNTVNVTQLNQHFTDQQTRTGPIWKSWRDISLVLLIIFNLFMLVYVIVTRMKLLELLTSFLLRRQESKQQQVTMTQKKNRIVRGYPSDVELDNVSTIDRNHLRY